MSTIDWSQGPDGATGYGNKNEYYEECWYKDITKTSFYCMPVSTMEWVHSFDMWQMKERKVIIRSAIGVKS